MTLDSTRLADAGAATSIVAWLSSIAVQALPIIQLIAGVVAIVAGVLAARYHWKKARYID